jgi:sugar transferase (PEP-CTERM/EpsH1 system associated)
LTHKTEVNRSPFVNRHLPLSDQSSFIIDLTMRILLLTPQLPYPPRQGTALRNWGILSNLARNHEVWLLSFVEPGTDSQTLAPELAAACHTIATFPIPQRSTAERLRRLITSSLPDMAWRLWSPEMAACMKEWVTRNHFDIVQVEGIELARYALTSPIDTRHTKIVFDDHNCEYLLQRRACETDMLQPKRWHAAAYSLVQWQRLRGFERRTARNAQATLCVSPQDASALAELDASIRAHVIFNGIDVASYTDVDAVTPADAGPQDGMLVFTGKMDFRPNVDAMLWFAHDVFPIVKRSKPNVHLCIVGQQPSPRLNVLRGDPNITITGEVSMRDLRRYIAMADVYIAPLRVGGGTRFKLLEAMAMRRAIVSTTLGCEGFDVTDGRELLIGDTPQTFAQAVVSLLDDDTLRLSLGRRAHAFVSGTYDWGAIVPQLERIYNSLISYREENRL